MKLFKIEFNKLKKFFEKKSEILAENSILTFLILFCLAFIFSGLVFYKYGYLDMKKQLDFSEKESIFLDKNKIKEISDILESNHKEFERVESKEFPNLLPL